MTQSVDKEKRGDTQQPSGTRLASPFPLFAQHLN
jgi:hypothetical protein